MSNQGDHSLAVAERLRHAAHEMRAPLNAVISFAQLLRGAGAAGLRQSDAYLHNIETAARQLSALVADLTDLPDFERGTVSIALEWVSVEEPAREALCIIQPCAADSGVKVALLVRTVGLAAIGDRTRMLQVLLNLLSNAIKYGRGLTGQVELVLSAGEDGSSVRLSVQDHGPGHTEDQACRPFRSFERLGHGGHGGGAHIR